MNTLKTYKAVAQDRDKLISALVAAFIHDPIARWVWPEPHAYLSNYPAFVEAFGGSAIEGGTALYSGDHIGGALWLAPGVAPDEARLAEILQSSIAPERLDVVFNFIQQMGEHHPKDPVWHLTMIGVDPTQYGCGHGAAMMHAFLERIDAAGEPAYLESSNPANISLYQRHGFEVTGRIQVGDSPVMHPMFRPARV